MVRARSTTAWWLPRRPSIQIVCHVDSHHTDCLGSRISITRRLRRGVASQEIPASIDREGTVSVLNDAFTNLGQDMIVLRVQHFLDGTPFTFRVHLERRLMCELVC